MRILATICARGGSKGVPNKNISILKGKPLIAHTIECAKKYTKFNRIVVSTDSLEIAEIAKQYEADVPFLRPVELATDTSPKIPVLQHAVKYLEEQENDYYDLIVDLDPTSPLREVQDIENCVNKMINERPDIVFSVTEAHKNPYFNMVEEQDGRVFLSKKTDGGVARRQDAPKVYAMNASIYVYQKEFLLSTKSVFSENSMAVVMPEERSIDIDRPIDFEFVEFLMKKKSYLEQNLFNLANKTILITGGAGLIGSTFVETLYEYGANIIIGDINPNKVMELIKEIDKQDRKNKIIYEYLDITNSDSVYKCINSIISEFSKIDVLINNAYPRNKNYGAKYEDITIEDWKENVDMHLNGYFQVTHAVSNQMIKQGFGKIINISSIYGLRGPRFSIYEGTTMTMPAEYAAIKGGLVNLTRYLATYLGRYQITANSISFGGVFDHQPSSFVEKYCSNVPLGRMAYKDDVRGVILFLSSDSSNYITGQNIIVDGGWTAS